MLIGWVEYRMESKEDHQCTYSTYTERNSIPVSSSIISKFDSYFRHTRDRYSYIWRKAGLLFQNFPLRHVWILVPRMIWYLSTYIERNSIPVPSSIVSKFDTYFCYIWRKAGLLFSKFSMRHVWILVPRMI